MAAPKKNPRARSSGFSRQLLRLYAENLAALRTSGVAPGPTNNARLAAWLTERGETARARTCWSWESGHTLPESRFVGLLEELFGAPWVYLDNAKNHVGIKALDRAIFLAAYARDPRERERAALLVRQLAGDRTTGG